MFTNTDTRPHSILSDPIDTHTECPPVNQVGLLNRGESRTTGTLNLSRVCRFHDQLNRSDDAEEPDHRRMNDQDTSRGGNIAVHPAELGLSRRMNPS